MRHLRTSKTVAADTRSMYIPCIKVLNKVDAISIEELDLLYKVC